MLTNHLHLYTPNYFTTHYIDLFGILSTYLHESQTDYAEQGTKINHSSTGCSQTLLSSTCVGIVFLCLVDDISRLMNEHFCWESATFQIGLTLQPSLFIYPSSSFSISAGKINQLIRLSAMLTRPLDPLTTSVQLQNNLQQKNELLVLVKLTDFFKASKTFLNSLNGIGNTSHKIDKPIMDHQS